MAAHGAGAASAEPEVSASDLPRIKPVEPRDALRTFEVRHGFQLQLAAAEPVVVDPVAMDFDENGRLFVVEMRDYSERREEHLGRVRMLEDTDGDGRYDRSTVYVDNLPWPTAVLCYHGGVFIGATPDILYCKDTTGDGVADTRETVFTGFASHSLQRLNVQGLLNSFRWGLDNRVHGSASVSGGLITSPRFKGWKGVDLRGRDFSFDPRQFDLRPETGGGQHGMSFDNAGRKFLCSNSDHVQEVVYEDRYAGLNPNAELPSAHRSIAVDGPAAEVFRISPDEPWRVIRTQWRVTGAVPGLIEGGGRPSGYFTAATGITIYRGSAFPREYVGDAFVADCGSNLIHHKKLHPDGPGFRAERPADELRREFIASRDNWFRPVQFANAPDGTLYVADMYRETIEHPWSLPESIKRHLDLNSGNDRGRIYRIAPTGFRPSRPPHLGEASLHDLVRLLEHPNGWHRDTAARLLFERHDRRAVPALARLARGSSSELGRMHALWALEGLGAVEDDLLSRALRDRAPLVKVQALRIAELHRGDNGLSAKLWAAIPPLARDADVRVRYQLAWTLGFVANPGKVAVLRDLLASPDPTESLTPPVLNAVGSDAAALLDTFLAAPAEGGRGAAGVAALARMVGARHDADELSAVAGRLSAMSPSPLTVAALAALGAGLDRSGDSLVRVVERSRIEPHLQLATSMAAGRGPAPASDAAAVTGLRLLSRLPFDWVEAGLMQALEPGRPAAIQRAALQAIADTRAPEAASRVLARWSRLERSLRTDAASLLLRRKAWTEALLAAIEEGRVARGEFTADQVQRLRSSSDEGVRRRAEKLFGVAHDGQRQEVINRFLPSLALVGDASRGRTLYDQRCANCHRAGGLGRAVGPDFESVRSMGKEKLLTQVLDPNREVAPNYLAYTVETISGESVTGLLVSDSPEGVRLKTSDGLETNIARGQLRRFEPSTNSLMPEGLEQGMTSQDVADLLEFIVAGPMVRR